MQMHAFFLFVCAGRRVANWATRRLRRLDADAVRPDPGPCFCTGRGGEGAGGLYVHEHTEAVVSVASTASKCGRARDGDDDRWVLVHIGLALGRWVNDPSDRGPGL